MKIKRICENCGKEFEIYESSLKSSNSSGKFCCRKCYNLYLKTLVGTKNKHYTSVEVKCANCGKLINKTPSKIKQYKNMFCSYKCKYEFHHNYVEGSKNRNWKGGFSRYRGTDFESVKKTYFQKPICAICGTEEHINIHHIIPYRLTKDNGIDNLIPLCRKHHKIIESHFTKYIEELGDYETSKFVLNNIYRTFYYSHFTKGVKHE